MYESSDAAIGTRHRQARQIALLLGMVLVAALILGGSVALLFRGSSGSIAKSAPRVPRTSGTWC